MAYTTIDKPDDYFNTILWTGDGTSSRSLTGVNFQPDWTWIKRRSDAQAHSITDSVRGVTKSLRSDSGGAEDTSNANGYLSSFDTDGFTVAKGSDPSRTNTSSATYVAWNWLADGTASSNSDGSITSSVSANTTSGFSVLTFTGTGSNATVGHGLGVAPKLVIVRRPGTQSWRVGCDAIGWGNVLYLNESDGTSAVATAFQSTAPTSSVFSVGTDTGVNGSGDSSIAYCFAEKKGYSKIGSYTGNGSADGTFVYTGFKPAFVMIKNTGSTHDWWMLDNKRDVDNPTNARLRANSTSADDSAGNSHDFLSNGFKLRTSGSADVNESSATMVYMAFAENPLVANVSGGIPATAR